jgi:hypothetical protein
VDLGEYPKMKKAVRLLKTSRPAVIGYLHLLWHWALTYAQDDDLSLFSDEEMPFAAAVSHSCAS